MQNSSCSVINKKNIGFLHFMNFDSTLEQFTEDKTFKLQKDIMHSTKKIKLNEQTIYGESQYLLYNFS